jgi:UDP-N-acetylmuramate dehydrogenase
MTSSEAAAPSAVARLSGIPHLRILRDEPLARYTRFALGGPADWLVETSDPAALVAAWGALRAAGLPYALIGGGTNLIVADAGFRGVVLRYGASDISIEGVTARAASGAVLQDLVDATVAAGLQGLETLSGIPGWVGAAIYGNAGAYGHSISECVREVRFTDGHAVRSFSNSECEFRYRESRFKAHKDWVILSATLDLRPGDPRELAKISAEILAIRNQKFPPSMKCAGSIFKNFLLAELPPRVAAEVPPAVVREGKVPAAYFLEQAGAKGMRRGGIAVASYHANLVYNDGSGSAAELVALIAELKQRVRERFGLELEEEVQYVGFER